MKAEQKVPVAASLVVLLLLCLPTIVVLSNPAGAASGSSTGPHLGFWLQESNIFAYSSSTFFNTMFLTPPYPSSIEVMIFAIQQAQTNSQGCTTSSGYIGQSLTYWGQVAQMADSYPNIKLIFEISFDASNGGANNGAGTYGLSCFNSMVQSLAQYSSVYGIGVEGEYTTPQSTAIYSSAYADVTNAGKYFINYYANPGMIPAGGYDITHTNFPGGDAGGYDQVGSIQNADAQTIGLDSGYYASYEFPSTVTCPIGSSAITSATAGWNQCVVSTELSAARSFSPASARQFLEIDVGFSSSGSFTGVSGQSTTQVWDNPTLRNWIWTDSNYQGNFVLSTAGSGSTTTSSTTSSTSSTSTTRTTSSTSTTSTTVRLLPPATSTTSTRATTSTSSSATSSTTTASTSSASGSYSLSTFVTCPVGIQYCGNASPIGSGNYNGGSQVNVTAYPYGGYLLGSWSICTSTCQSYYSNPLTITMTANTMATANFVAVVTSTTTSTTSTSTTSTSSVSSTQTSTTTTSTSHSTSSTSTTSTTSSVSQTDPDTTTTTTTGPTQSGTSYFTFSVQGGCPVNGVGSYPAGSTATVQFTGVCDRNTGTGLRVTSWSLDGGKQTPVNTNGTTTLSVVMNAPHTLYLNTVSQYYLSIDYGAQLSMLSVTSPTISGDNFWYDSGTVVTFTGITELQNYTVAGWILDEGNPIAVSGVPDFGASFTMGAPHTLHVLLSLTEPACASGGCDSNPNLDITVQTNSKLSSGMWVDNVHYPTSVTFAWPSGSVHNVTAAEGSSGSTVKTSFSGWSGLSETKARTVVLVVNASGYLTAEYTKEDLVWLNFTDAQGNPLTPQSVTLTGPQGKVELAANLTAWVVQGASYTISSVTWMSWNVVFANESKFSVEQPEALNFNTNVYSQTVKATDAYNLPLEGAAVNITTLNGVSMTASTNSQGLATFRVPMGLFSGTVDYLGVADSIISGSVGSHSYNVTFVLSYPLLATIGAVAATVSTFAVYRLRRKKPIGGPQFFPD